MIEYNDLLSLSDHQIINGYPVKRQGFISASIDSRTIEKNQLFIAVKGDNTDGHNYLKQVFEKGVRAAIVEKSRLSIYKQTFPERSFVGVPDTIKALGELGKNQRRKYNPIVVAIAGSNGKTSTKDLTAAVASKKFKVLKTEGNYNNHIGLPLTLCRLNNTHNFCVLEAGCNHYGELTYLCEISEPNFGMVTNIGKEHLEFFKNEAGVAKAEFELYDCITTLPGAVCFFNLDDKYIEKYAAKIPKVKKFTYAYTKPADVTGKFTGYNSSFNPCFTVKHNNKSISLKVSTFGKHSIYNGLAAAAVGFYFDVSGAEIKSALADFKTGSSKRMEIEKYKGITIINDAYNSNPESVQMGLETLMEYKSSGNKYAVLGDMLELGRSSKREHTLAGKTASDLGVKNLFTYGKDSLNTHKAADKVKNAKHFKSHSEIAGELAKTIKKGDVLYLKGSRGMKMEEVLKQLKGRL